MGAVPRARAPRWSRRDARWRRGWTRAIERMPLPDVAMLERAQTAGVASGVLVGDRRDRRGGGAGRRRRAAARSTYLMLAMPLEAQDLQRATGRPGRCCPTASALSSVAGTAAQQTALAGLVGKEADGRAQRSRGGAGSRSSRRWGRSCGSGCCTVHGGAGLGRDPGAARRRSRVLLGVAAFLLRRGRAARSSWSRRDSRRPRLGRQGSRLAADDQRAATSASGAARSRTSRPRRSATGPPRCPRRHPARSRRDAGLERRHRRPRRGAGGVVSRARARRTGVEHVRPLPAARAARRGRHGGGLHGGPARRRGLRRVFVVKRLRPQLARNRAAVEQFIDEAKLGSTLVHSNIVPVFDFGKVGDEYFLAQEYILGRDLGTAAAAPHRDVRPAADRAAGRSTSCTRCWRRSRTRTAGPTATGSPHRRSSTATSRPATSWSSARGEVKLFDFGIVKAEGRVSKTEVGVVKGNVSFMSPEQARGQAVDARSDLFSLGLVSVLLPDRRAAVSGREHVRSADAGGDRAGDRAAEADRRAAAASSAVIARVLAVDPAQRYQTAAEFAAALAPHIVGRQGRRRRR